MCQSSSANRIILYINANHNGYHIKLPHCAYESGIVDGDDLFNCRNKYLIFKLHNNLVPNIHYLS